MKLTDDEEKILKNLYELELHLNDAYQTLVKEGYPASFVSQAREKIKCAIGDLEDFLAHKHFRDRER